MHFHLMLYYLLVYVIACVLLLVVLMFARRPLRLLHTNFNARYLAQIFVNSPKN
jgi:hypothetical protein